jgi:hypothetical protein
MSSETSHAAGTAEPFDGYLMSAGAAWRPSAGAGRGESVLICDLVGEDTPLCLWLLERRKAWEQAAATCPEHSIRIMNPAQALRRVISGGLLGALVRELMVLQQRSERR